MRKTRRFLPALLAGVSMGWVLLGCRSPASAPNEAAPSASASHAAVASARPPVPAASAKPGVGTPAAGEPPPDPAFDAFVKRVENESGAPVDPQSEQEADLHFRKMFDYALKRTRLLVQQLPPVRRARFLAPPEPRRTVSDDWHPAWNRFVEGTVLVNDVVEFSWPPYRTTGTMRGQVMGMLFSHSALEGLYRVETFSQGRARDFAEHVRIRGKGAAQARRTHAQLLEAVRDYAPFAPEAATYEDACGNCALADQDLAKIERTVRGLVLQAAQLSDALCRAWPELAEELGGSKECLTNVEDYYAAMVDGLSEEQTHEPPGPLKGEPPPRDAPYARYAGPVHDHCWMAPFNDFNPNAAITSCLQNEFTKQSHALTAARAGAAPKFLAAWSRFGKNLCSLEAQVEAHPMVSLTTRTYPHCDWLSALRASFLLRSWSKNDVAAVTEHVTHRAAWSTEFVQPALVLLETLARKPECPRDGSGDPTTCRDTFLNAVRWKDVEHRVAQLRPQAGAAARLTCEGWPELATAFGATCEKRLTDYYLSYGGSLGKAMVLKER
jgi:hypothetical protein